jgi:endonuclease III related protein
LSGDINLNQSIIKRSPASTLKRLSAPAFHSISVNVKIIEMRKSIEKQKLLEIYGLLLTHFGPQHWWPAEEPFEVMVGAILTQSAAWTNVEKGILNLKKAKALSPQALRTLSENEIAGLIHSCGYYNAKTVKLKAFVKWLGERFGDSLEKMFAEDIESLRRELLEIHGVGDETADSILLYAGNKPIFVIDAYTRRIIDRLGLKPPGDRYRDYQKLFMDNLPRDARLFNEYHALLVALGKHHCLKSQPVCDGCPVRERCSFINRANKL